MRWTRLSAGVVAAALLASCSTNPPAQQPNPSSSTEATTPGGHGSLAHCLAEHGVPAAPGPAAGPPPGVPEQTWKDAMQACSSLAPGPAG